MSKVSGLTDHGPICNAFKARKNTSLHFATETVPAKSCLGARIIKECQGPLCHACEAYWRLMHARRIW